MIKKYGVILPSSGETTIVSTKEEAINLFWERMVEFSFPYFHNTFYVSIDYNDDGTETWYNESEDEIDKILSIQERDELIKLSAQKIKTKIVEDITSNGNTNE